MCLLQTQRFLALSLSLLLAAGNAGACVAQESLEQGHNQVGEEGPALSQATQTNTGVQGSQIQQARPGFPGSATMARPGFPGSATTVRPGFPGSATTVRPGFPGSASGVRPGFPASATTTRPGISGTQARTGRSTFKGFQDFRHGPSPRSSLHTTNTGSAEQNPQFFLPFSQRSTTSNTPLLHGAVSVQKGPSPFLMDSVHEVSTGTKVNLVVPTGVFLNSEVSQKGDEVQMRIATDVKDGGRVVLPAGWYVRGLVTQVEAQKRGGRDGYVEVVFDKLVSPTGEYELDFNAKFSTKESKLKSATKLIAKDSLYVGAGAAAGALISVQATGLATAIATHGISVGGGAAVGASIGLFAALKRKGQVRNILPGESLKLETCEPISLPGFDPKMLLSAAPKPHLKGLDLVVNDFHFRKTPWEDKSARLLELELDVTNRTSKTFHFFDLLVESDQLERYSPTPFGGFDALKMSVPPKGEGSGTVTFTVGSSKRKYFLVFLSRSSGEELTRVPIN